MPRRYFQVGPSARSLASATALFHSSGSKSPRPIQASATSAADSSTSRSLMNWTSSLRIEWPAASVNMTRSPSSVGLEASDPTPTSSPSNSRDFSMTKQTFAGLISGIGRSDTSIFRMSGRSSLVSQAPLRPTRLAANQLKRGKPALTPQNGRSEGYTDFGLDRQVLFVTRAGRPRLRNRNGEHVADDLRLFQGHLNWSPR